MAQSRYQDIEYPLIPNWDYYRNRYDIVVEAHEPYLLRDLPANYMWRIRWNFADRTFRVVIGTDGHTYRDWRVWRARDPVSAEEFDDIITAVRQRFELILH